MRKYPKKVRHESYIKALECLKPMVKQGNVICTTLMYVIWDATVLSSEGLWPELKKLKPKRIKEEYYPYWFAIGAYKKREAILKKCIKMTAPKRKPKK